MLWDRDSQKYHWKRKNKVTCDILVCIYRRLIHIRVAFLKMSVVNFHSKNYARTTDNS